jgi:hypothetical protein
MVGQIAKALGRTKPNLPKSREGQVDTGRKVTRTSLTNKASIAGTFPGETPTQIAQHQEIARRHRRRCKDGTALIPRLRIAELQRIFVFNYGARCLPDDDAGRADLRLMADHLAQIDPRLIRPWAAAWMPTLTPAELDALVEQVGSGRRWKADALARELGLNDATRTRLKIKTIGAVDCGKSKRMNRRCRKRIAADRARRARAGARPHAQSAAATQPWIDEGISRRTWYRRRAQVGTVGTESRPLVRSTSIEEVQCQGTPADTADPAREQRAEASTFTAKPLPSGSFRMDQLSGQATLDPIAGLEKTSANAAFRDAHYERFQLIVAMPLDPKQKARLAELDGLIEAQRNRLEERRSLRMKLAAEDFSTTCPRAILKGQRRLDRPQK